MTRGLEEPCLPASWRPCRPVAGQESPASATPSLHSQLQRGSLGVKWGGGAANSAVAGELPATAAAQLAQGLSFSISQMETNWPL